MQSRRNTSFVTLPIVALAIASLGVVLASLAIGAREADEIALARQRETIRQALEQHGNALTRELRIETVWSEAYARTRSNDVNWINLYYGKYLSALLGYDGIYVLGPDNAAVYGYVPGDEANSGYGRVGPHIADLLQAVRSPRTVPPNYDVIATDIPLANGTVAHHYSIADVRKIGGRPYTVVVSTIVPDRSYDAPVSGAPMLLVAIEEIDTDFTRQLGRNFGFNDMKWVADGTPPGDTGELVTSLSGTPVGTIVWHRDRPGLEFVRHVAPGLLLALILVGVLTWLLILWGNRQARRILESERHATRAARTDLLTALPNRVALRDIFARLLRDAKTAASNLAVLSIDLDHFKAINDAFGHAVGDEVLRMSAQRLRALVSNKGVVARPDGDSFVLLAPIGGERDAAELANDVIAVLAEPFDLESGTRVHITASVGYAIGLRDGDSGDELMRRAELAVDRAKVDSEPAAVAFTPDMDAEVTYRLMLETALRAAVAEGDIGVAYQPLMDPSGRRALGVEALARWTDPELGPVSPDVFIPLAEEAGLIQNIGEQVLLRAVEDAKAWPDIPVAVNVSASQIHHGNIVEVVRAALAESRFPAERLEIEITESVLLADEKRANDQIRGLQALGVRVALDDFGTGYSSLQYLRRFGFDKLKIDRSFIDGAGDPDGSSVILASIIRLGQDLDLTITAEGIENERQRRWLQGAGCHQLQGYLFSRPLTAERMTAFIAAHHADTAVAS